MKKIDMNLIWNYNSDSYMYRPDKSFLEAFSKYLIITKSNNKYIIEDDVIAPVFATQFQLEDKITFFKESIFLNNSYISSGRHHMITFNEFDLKSIINVLQDNCINFAIIDQDSNSIAFENYNEYNGYTYMRILLKERLSFNDVLDKLNIFNKKIKNGYRLVNELSFVEILNLKTGENLKLAFSQEHLDLDNRGVYVVKRDEGTYKGYEYINKISPMAQMIIGKFENDEFTIDDNYKILSVKNYDEI